MQPRNLQGDNGNVKATTGKRSVSSEMTEAMKQELVNTPVRSYQAPTPSSFVQRAENVKGDEESDEEDEHVAIEHDPPIESTPTGSVSYDRVLARTPAPLGEASKLVQMTCPPKQINQGLFDDIKVREDVDKENTMLPSKKRKRTDVDDERDESRKRKVEAVRRKTLGWKPAVASPLGL